MKSIKKLISLTICIALLAFSMTAFAAIENEEVIDFKIKADSYNINVGDEVTLTIYADGKTGSEVLTSLYYYIKYKSAEWEYVSSEPTGVDGAKANGEYDRQFRYEGDLDGSTSYSYSNLGTVTFKALKAGTNVLDLFGTWIGDEEYNASAEDGETITFTVTAPSTAETKEATVSETPIIDKAGNTWTFTDAKAFLISATGFTKTSGTMSCELTLEAGNVKSINIPGTFSNPTVTFQALVHGVTKAFTPTATITVE